MNSFTFYKNYYYLIKSLNEENQNVIRKAILDYMFEDINPTFTEADGELFYIWINLKMPLDTSKKQGYNSLKTKQNPKEIQKKSKQKPKRNQTKTNNISTFLFLFSNLNINNNRKDIEDLFKEYLELRVKQKYVLSETVVTRLINKLNEYGKTDKAKKEIIQNAINGAWKDFYPLKEGALPDWCDEDYKEDPIENSEIKELIGKYE